MHGTHHFQTFHTSSCLQGTASDQEAHKFISILFLLSMLLQNLENPPRSKAPVFMVVHQEDHKLEILREVGFLYFLQSDHNKHILFTPKVMKMDDGSI